MYRSHEPVSRPNVRLFDLYEPSDVPLWMQSPWTQAALLFGVGAFVGMGVLLLNQGVPDGPDAFRRLLADVPRVAGGWGLAAALLSLWIGPRKRRVAFNSDGLVFNPSSEDSMPYRYDQFVSYEIQSFEFEGRPTRRLALNHLDGRRYRLEIPPELSDDKIRRDLMGRLAEKRR